MWVEHAIQGVAGQIATASSWRYNPSVMTMRLSNIRILYKVMISFALFGIVVVGAIWFSSSRMQTISRSFSDILDTEVPGMKEALSANQRVTEFGRLSWRLIAETDPDDMKRTAIEVVQSGKVFAYNIAAAKKVLPTLVEKLDQAQALYDDAVKDYPPIEKLAMENKTTDAIRQANELSKKTSTLRIHMVDIISSTEKLMRDKSATASSSVINTVYLTSLYIGVAAMTVLLLAVAVVQFSIAKPFKNLTSAMAELAQGNFEVKLSGVGRKDEVGQIADAVELFKTKAIEKAERDARERASLDEIATQRRREDMHRMAGDFEGAVGQIIEVVSSAATELEQSASILSRTAISTQDLSSMVADASDVASGNVHSVASATEEMASSVSEIGRQVQESNAIAMNAVEDARRTNDRVKELSEAAGKIGDVVGLISDIAAQTNLLALNATIEAARAGDAGRGFAVVASEVKALAEQTSKATEEIAKQIGGIQAATNESVTAIQQISGTIKRISDISAAIAASVDQQGTATQEIARNVQQAAAGTSEVAARIGEVLSGAKETGASSGRVLSAAQALTGESSKLKFEVGKFLHTVRAA